MLISDNSAVWYTQIIRLQWMSARFDFKWCGVCYWNYHLILWKDDLEQCQTGLTVSQQL